MKFLDERYDFDVMLYDNLIAKVRFIDGRVHITKVCKNRIFQVFAMENPGINDVYTFLKSRCYEDGRGDLKEILDAANMESNNPWKWCKLTHGVTYEDYYWIRLIGENLTWKDVKLHD